MLELKSIIFIGMYHIIYHPFNNKEFYLKNFCKTPTELRYVERSVSMKEVYNENLRNFELGSQESMNVPIWIIVGFQQRDRQDSQNLNNDRFCRLPVVSAQAIFGTEKNPDAGIILN